MASDNHAHYGRIGFTVFIGIIAITLTLIFIAGVGDASSEILVETYSDSSVSGLSVGSPVNMRGVKIGEVRNINFTAATYGERITTNDLQRVTIIMAIDLRKFGNPTKEEVRETLRALVEIGLRAMVTSNGITGLSRIELNIEKYPTPLTVQEWTPQYPLIPPQPSLIDSFAVAATKALNTMNKTDFQTTWSNITVVASSTAKLAENVNNIVEQERESVNDIVSNVNETTAEVKELISLIKRNPSLIIRNNDPEPLPEME